MGFLHKKFWGRFCFLHIFIRSLILTHVCSYWAHKIENIYNFDIYYSGAHKNRIWKRCLSNIMFKWCWFDGNLSSLNLILKIAFLFVFIRVSHIPQEVFTLLTQRVNKVDILLKIYFGLGDSPQFFRLFLS